MNTARDIGMHFIYCHKKEHNFIRTYATLANSNSKFYARTHK